MPSNVSSLQPTPTSNKAAPQKPQPGQQPRKKRVGRRRGRGQNGMGSDDELEREAASDTDSNDDRSSSDDSATDDSDTEPASEDAPSHSASPPATAAVNVAGETNMNGVAPFFASTSTWSEMVADENANGPSGLPVIDFTEFDGAAKIPARRNKKPQKQRKAQAPPAPLELNTQQSAEAPEPEPERRPTSPPRKLGQTARQAYQQRLETDPSYVPKVGGFWGHDDRLMEKDLRSLSGWWRGKWSGGARGRGFGMRGGARGNGHDQHEARPEDLPPVERAWTHDGFEEMKRKEERRQHDAPVGPGRGGFRGGRGGRGGFAGRGRGSFGHRIASPASSTGALSPIAQQNHNRFPPKHELTWSKQSEAFLFFETNFRGRHWQKPGVRVKLPGKESQIAKPIAKPSQAAKDLSVVKPSESTTEHKDLQYTVHLPTRRVQTQDVPRTSALIVQQPLAGPVPAHQVGGDKTQANPLPPPISVEQAPLDAPTEGLPNPAIISQLEQLTLAPRPSDPERRAITEEAVLRNSGPNSQVTSENGEVGALVEPRPVLPHLQTVFTPPPPPVSQPSPVYGSPYTFPQALPPGIALNHQGMPYEVATGRPVYLQPPAMYNPRPIHYPPPGIPYMHGHGHVHHAPAVSPDYLAQSSSHTPPMNGFVDPATGAPIFALPRSVRIEIRAPDESRPVSSPTRNGTTLKSPPLTHAPWKLRTGATVFEPGRPSNGEVYPSIGTPFEGGSQLPSYDNSNGLLDNGPQQPPPPMGNVMQYPTYQQPYYYPEPYGYTGYVDMSQVGQYEMYNMDQPQGTVYY